MDLTLVTAFYDLNKLEKRPVEKTKNNYLMWGEFIFKMDINIVFFVEAENYEYVWRKRAEKKLLHKTLIIKKEYSELRFYDMREELEIYKKEHPLMNSLLNKDSANYIVLTWNKIFFVEDVMKLNPFNTNYFGWIDFGLYNIVMRDTMPSNIYETLTPTTKKIKMLELHHVFDKETVNIYNYCAYFRWKYAGGLWTGHTSTLPTLFSHFKKQLFEILSLRIFAHEETIFALTYSKNKDLFELYYGSYPQILINYNKIRSPVDMIFENIKECRYNGEFKHAFDIAEKVYNECYDNLNVVKKFITYDELIVNGSHIDQSKAEDYAKKFIDDVEKDIDLKMEFMKDANRNISNLKSFKNEYIDKKLELISN